MDIWNERVKLVSNWLNSVSVAMIALGMLAPTAKVLFEGGPQTNAVILVWWGLGGLSIHAVALWVLRDIRE